MANVLPLVTRTLRFEVRSKSHRTLNAAAMTVNPVYNYCNATSYPGATRMSRKRRWLSLFDLCNLTARAAGQFDRIGADTIQAVCTCFAEKPNAARKILMLGSRHRICVGRNAALPPPHLCRVREAGYAAQRRAA